MPTFEDYVDFWEGLLQDVVKFQWKLYNLPNLRENGIFWAGDETRYRHTVSSILS